MPPPRSLRQLTPEVQCRCRDFRHPVIIDLNAFSDSGRVAVLRDHDLGKVVGHAESVSVDQNGVHVEGFVSGANEHAREVVESSRNGFTWNMSVGMNPGFRDVEHLRAGKKAVVNGREIVGPHTIVRRAPLQEVSFTAVGADLNTTAAIAASLNQEKGDVMTFDDWLESKGIEASAVTEATKPVFEAQFEAELEGDSGKPPKIAANASQTINLADSEIESLVQRSVQAAVSEATLKTQQEIHAKYEHDAKLSAICANHPDLAVKAKAENWSLDKAELEVIRADRPRPIFASAGSTDGAPDTSRVFEAAICLNACGSVAPEKVGF